MKVLVCGSRSTPSSLAPDLKKLLQDIHATIVIQGEARGADLLAKQVAIDLGLQVESFPADWKGLGKQAGFIRNQQMIDQKPDVVIAIYPIGGVTNGTADTIRRAAANKIQLIELKFGGTMNEAPWCPWCFCESHERQDTDESYKHVAAVPRPSGIRGQVVTPWDFGGWKCLVHQIALPKNEWATTMGWAADRCGYEYDEYKGDVARALK